jgi:hypothetical protein
LCTGSFPSRLLNFACLSAAPYIPPIDPFIAENDVQNFDDTFLDIEPVEDSVDVFDGYSFKGRHFVLIDDEDEEADGSEEASEDEHEHDALITGAVLAPLGATAQTPTVDVMVEEIPDEPKTRASLLKEEVVKEVAQRASEQDEIQPGQSKELPKPGPLNSLFARGVIDRYRLAAVRLRAPSYPIASQSFSGRFKS